MASVKKGLVCSCAFERNIFIKRMKMHIIFKSKEQFLRDYEKDLSRRSLKKQQLDGVISEVLNEIERRKASGSESIRRKELILEKYRYLHPHLLKLKEEYLADEFLKLHTISLENGVTKETLINNMKQENEEMESFTKSGLPIGKPNTMNDFGILLSEIGFKENFFNPLVFTYLNPIAKILYPDWVGQGLDSHRSFIVGYEIGKDIDLSYHYDDAEITLNVSLGKKFEGGELYIAGMKDELNWPENCYKYEHKKTYGLLHRGQQMHGAMEIENGERYNLVIWMRSSSVRNLCCPMCNRRPRLVEVEGDGAGFTRNEVDICCTI